MKGNSPKFTKYASLVGALMLAALIISACQPAAASSPAAPTTAPVTAQAEAFQEPTISVVTDPKLGEILVGDNGMTLYIFTKDEPGKSNCNADCLVAWPPLLTQGSPSLGAGIDRALVGSAPLADGTLIVTYNQMPLYYYAKDVQPGDTTGQDVGQVWYVISPAGAVVMPQPANPPASSNENSNNNNNEDKGYDY